MEAEGCFLHRRKQSHKKTLVPRSPTSSCWVSLGVATLVNERAGGARAGGPPLWVVRGLGLDEGGPPRLATLGGPSREPQRGPEGPPRSGPCDGFLVSPRTMPKSSVAPWAVLTVSMMSSWSLSWMVDVLGVGTPRARLDGIPHSQWCLCPGFPLAGSRRQDPGGGELIPYLVPSWCLKLRRTRGWVLHRSTSWLFRFRFAQ